MTWTTFKRYFLTISSGVILLAAVILLILQWAVKSTFSIYGKQVEVNTGLLIIGSMVAGIAFVPLARTLLKGVWSIRKIRQQQKRSGQA